MSVTFRSAPEPSTDTVPVPDEFKPNEYGVKESAEDIEPISSSKVGDVLLEGLGIKDSNGMDGDSAENLDETSKYIESIVKRKGLTPTRSVYQRVFKETMDDLGIDPDTEAEVVFDRIGGMTKAWRDLMFIKDAGDRRRIFMKLSRLESSKEMNDLVFKEMEGRLWL